MDQNTTYTMRLGKELYHFTEQVFWKFVTPTDHIAIFLSQEVFGNLVSKLLFSVLTFFAPMIFHYAFTLFIYRHKKNKKKRLTLALTVLSRV